MIEYYSSYKIDRNEFSRLLAVSRLLRNKFKQIKGKRLLCRRCFTAPEWIFKVILCGWIRHGHKEISRAKGNPFSSLLETICVLGRTKNLGDSLVRYSKKFQ